MLKNKKGFTLIELLVAIAIMISITVVAIVSITKIGEQNKKQAYELVQEQVKTAALEFFSANEYLFEGIVNAEGKINVKRLVEEGYLNSLTNPVTGKKLNGCDYIEVSKSNGKYNYNFKTDNSPNCPYNSYLITKAKEDPEISVNPSCNVMGNNGWCRDYETVAVTVEDSSVSVIKYQLNGYVNDDSPSMTAVVVDGETKFEFKDYERSPDSQGTSFQISIPGTSIFSIGTYYIDNTVPKVEFISKIYGKDNYKINLIDKQLTKDDISDLKYELEDDEGFVKKQGNIIDLYDYSGEWTNKDVVVMPYINPVIGPTNTETLKIGPTGIETFSCNFTNNGTKNILDKNTGYSLFTRRNLYTTLYCSATTGAGNTDSSETVLKVDDQPPTCEITESGKNTIASSYDSSTNKTFELKTDDNLSGISKSVISNSTIGNLDNYSSSNVLNLNIGSNSFSLNGKVRDNAGNENTCNTGTIAVNTYSDCKLEVVAKDKTKIVNDWYNIATGQPEIQSIVNGVVRYTEPAREGKNSYSFKDSGYNCKSTPSAIEVKYDPIVPTVDLIMKKKINSDKVYDIDDISSLSNYTNGEIYKGYVFTKVNVTAGRSGATVLCSDTNYDYILGGTHGPYDNFETYRNVNREGVTTIKCTATSGAGVKSSEISKTIKLERNLKMVLNEDKMKNVVSVNNSSNKVFNTKYSGIKYYSNSDYMECKEYSSSNTYGCKLGGSLKSGYLGFIATACKNVGGYARHFTIDSPVHSGINTWLYDYEESADDTLFGIIYDKQNEDYLRTCTNLNSSFNTNCGNKATGTPNFTTHKYYYQSYSGAKSNEVILYTKYTIECGYIK